MKIFSEKNSISHVKIKMSKWGEYDTYKKWLFLYEKL